MEPLNINNAVDLITKFATESSITKNRANNYTKAADVVLKALRNNQIDPNSVAKSQLLKNVTIIVNRLENNALLLKNLPDGPPIALIKAFESLRSVIREKSVHEQHPISSHEEPAPVVKFSPEDQLPHYPQNKPGKERSAKASTRKKLKPEKLAAGESERLMKTQISASDAKTRSSANVESLKFDLEKTELFDNAVSLISQMPIDELRDINPGSLEASEKKALLQKLNLIVKALKNEDFTIEKKMYHEKEKIVVIPGDYLPLAEAKIADIKISDLLANKQVDSRSIGRVKKLAQDIGNAIELNKNLSELDVTQLERVRGKLTETIFLLTDILDDPKFAPFKSVYPEYLSPDFLKTCKDRLTGIEALLTQKG